MPKIDQEQEQLTPFWQTADGETVRLFHGDVIEVLQRLPAASVQMCVTSPPYWGLRDYGTGTWEGGDLACAHKVGSGRTSTAQKVMPGYARPFRAGKAFSDHREEPIGAVCRCGAVRGGDRQIGSEPSPDCGTQGRAQCGCCFVCKMVEVFREVKRVLRDDGTLWLNLGDTYSGGTLGRNDKKDGGGLYDGEQRNWRNETNRSRAAVGLPSGNLVGAPWRVALALQADGWILRQDIIWMKPSPMPESVRNRCTKAHEYVFLFAKRRDYFYDAEAIKEPLQNSTKAVPALEAGAGRCDDGFNAFISDGRGILHVPRGANKRSVWGVGEERRLLDWMATNAPERLAEFLEQSANKGDVWTVSSQGYEGAHFACYPPKLIEPMILAGTSAHGACARCGAPWRRVVEREQLKRERPNDYVKRTGEAGTGNSCANSVAGVDAKTVGWEPICECLGRFEKRRMKVKGFGSYHDHDADGVEYGLRQGGKGPKKPGTYEADKDFERTVSVYASDLPLEEHPVRPCVVLDPFIGSGTTAAVAVAHGRRCWGIDLSEEYLRANAIPRIEGVLSENPSLSALAGRQFKAVAFGGRK